jgi:hypothetical protein
MYSLLTINAFHLPINPGPAADYTCANPHNLTPLTCTEQASVDTAFLQQKHYFLSLQNIKRACFNALDLSINDAFKVPNDPAIHKDGKWACLPRNLGPVVHILRTAYPSRDGTE